MIATALNGQRQGRLRSDQLALIPRDAKAAELGTHCQTLHGHTPRSMGRSLPEQRTLTPSFLVRIRVPQPVIKRSILHILLSFQEAYFLRICGGYRSRVQSDSWQRRLHSRIGSAASVTV